ncbi:hypothetical protein D9611_007862 [Ephemerocybe angulata]|uniref:Uncharacterized protein n=1 Tax=Ephemerocybe angulata TaxID=980116 RepID=A0A8H5CFI0_9AGAR|nr:hypothetical protein D9611_007862 [Tulosesus angulatus]
MSSPAKHALADVDKLMLANGSPASTPTLDPHRHYRKTLSSISTNTPVRTVRRGSRANLQQPVLARRPAQKAPLARGPPSFYPTPCPPGRVKVTNTVYPQNPISTPQGLIDDSPTSVALGRTILLDSFMLCSPDSVSGEGPMYYSVFVDTDFQEGGIITDFSKQSDTNPFLPITPELGGPDSNSVVDEETDSSIGVLGNQIPFPTLTETSLFEADGETPMESVDWVADGETPMGSVNWVNQELATACPEETFGPFSPSLTDAHEDGLVRPARNVEEPVNEGDGQWVTPYDYTDLMFTTPIPLSSGVVAHTSSNGTLLGGFGDIASTEAIEPSSGVVTHTSSNATLLGGFGDIASTEAIEPSSGVVTHTSSNATLLGGFGDIASTEAIEPSSGVVTHMSSNATLLGGFGDIASTEAIEPVVPPLGALPFYSPPQLDFANFSPGPQEIPGATPGTINLLYQNCTYYQATDALLASCKIQNYNPRRPSPSAIDIIIRMGQWFGPGVTRSDLRQVLRKCLNCHHFLYTERRAYHECSAPPLAAQAPDFDFVGGMLGSFYNSGLRRRDLHCLFVLCGGCGRIILRLAVIYHRCPGGNWNVNIDDN